MFEDSTFETMGRIHTRSRGWMMATFAFNSSILLALVIIPILHPEMLPQLTSAIMMEAPPTQADEPKPVARPEHATPARLEMHGGVLVVPSKIPKDPYIPGKPEEPAPDTVAALGDGGPGPGNPLTGRGTHPDVRPAVMPKPHVSSGVMEGMLFHKVVPTYPAVAQAARVSGTVVLQATISRSGTIENLRAVGGPVLLRQAALDAVKQWRYRPYMLNGQPVEVETTVDVQFTLD